MVKYYAGVVSGWRVDAPILPAVAAYVPVVTVTANQLVVTMI